MIKHFCFGAISPDELNEYGADYTPFMADEQPCEFELRVDLIDGYAQLRDSVGRMVPIDKAHYSELIAALTVAQELQDDRDELDNVPHLLFIKD